MSERSVRNLMKVLALSGMLMMTAGALAMGYGFGMPPLPSPTDTLGPVACETQAIAGRLIAP